MPQYNEMPEGVKIEFYDAYLQVTGTITSKYAINDEIKQTTIFRKNVVVVNDKMTFTTEELTWDESKKLYSSPYGTVVTKTGDVLTGSAFSAPQDFSTYKINTASGEGYIKGEIKP
jgi:lipopolysaccharide export system protein LptA